MATTSANAAGKQSDQGKQSGRGRGSAAGNRAYKWVALSNTTLAMTMATIDASIVIVSMPAIFRGIGLNPLTPGNVTYLLWMIMGYLLVQSVLVVSLGRLGDMFGRVKIYNLGFVVFTAASVALSLDPLVGAHGAHFRDRCFTSAEQAYCARSPKRYYEHLAGRFAAKEAVLKVLGFRPWMVMALVLGEAILIGALSGFMATATAFAAINAVGGIPFPIAFFPKFFIPADALWWGPAIGAFVAVLGSVMPAWTAQSVKVSEVFSKVT